MWVATNAYGPKSCQKVFYRHMCITGRNSASPSLPLSPLISDWLWGFNFRDKNLIICLTPGKLLESLVLFISLSLSQNTPLSWYTLPYISLYIDTQKYGGFSPNSLRPISYFGSIWELHVLDLKTNLSCIKKIQLHFPMNKGLTVPK